MPTSATPGRGFRNSASLETGHVALDRGVLNFRHKGEFIRAWLAGWDGRGGVHVIVDYGEGQTASYWTGLRAIRRVNGR